MDADEQYMLEKNGRQMESRICPWRLILLSLLLFFSDQNGPYKNVQTETENWICDLIILRELSLFSDSDNPYKLTEDQWILWFID